MNLTTQMMKYLYIAAFLLPAMLWSQRSLRDSLNSSEYIDNYHDQLNIRFEISNELKSYVIPVDGTDARISPNISFRYALGFNYKFVSVRLGIRSGAAKKDQEKKGDSDNFRLRVKFLFSKWSHRFEYNYVRGFYIKNTDDFVPGGDDFINYILFPNMKTNVFSGTTAYKLNPNYSIRATEAQTEIQRKTAGTFMPSIDYWIYKINDNQIYIDYNGNEVVRDYFQQFKGMNTILNLGYYYTYVYRKNWYLNVFAAPGGGYDFYQVTTTTHNGVSSDNISSFVFSLQGGVAVGYNTDKFYFGADYKNRHTYEKYSEDRFKFNTSLNEFHVFIGYRFKPPKVVTTSVDYIEKKVPILDQEKSEKDKKL